MKINTKQLLYIYKITKKQPITLPELLVKLQQEDSSISIEDLSYSLWDTYY